MNEVNELFTKENVEKIYVPDIVKDDLLSIIEEKLKKAGFYYRVAYRVKAPDSMLDKLILKDYRRPGTENQDKKMQDLIGIRIILYYADDVEIVKNFLDTIFSMPGVWNTTEANEYEFRAMKINGIFKLPGYRSKTIVNPELGDYVENYPSGTYNLSIRQMMDGIPIYTDIGSRLSLDLASDKGKKGVNSFWRKNVKLWRVRDNYFEFMNRSRFELDAVWLKRVNKIEEDVPLKNVDVIINNLKKEIEKGKIRKIYALKLGHCCPPGHRYTRGQWPPAALPH